MKKKLKECGYPYRVRAAYKSGLLYTTSPQREGYLILYGEGVGTIGFADGMKMIFAEKKALGGFGKMKDFVSACFCEGAASKPE